MIVSLVDGVDRSVFVQRGVEAVIWGMPLVNYQLMRDAATALGVGDTGIVYWSTPPDALNQTLTPNPDVIYLMAFFDLTDGPVVFDVPAAGGGVLNASIMNEFQVAIEDVGPAGVDAGRGGRIVVARDGWVGELPDGAILLHSDTTRGYALIRSIPQGDGDDAIAAAVDYGTQLTISPLGGAEAAPVDGSGRLFDARIPYDVRFFDALHRSLQGDGWLERDRVMIDILGTLGIERGGEFSPTDEQRELLDEAAARAHAWLDRRYEELFTPFVPDARWSLPVLPALIRSSEANFTVPDVYPVDGRGTLYSFAFFSSKHLGKGQFYLVAIQDADGQPFDGGRSYTITLPADAPVTQYWSVTVYDRETHTLLDGVKRAGTSSLTPGLVTDDDGTITIRLGPDASEGADANGVPTLPGRPFELMFRFYGPTPALSDHSWVLPDVRLA